MHVRIFLKLAIGHPETHPSSFCFSYGSSKAFRAVGCAIKWHVDGEAHWCEEGRLTTAVDF